MQSNEILLDKLANCKQIIFSKNGGISQLLIIRKQIKDKIKII